jgi:2-phospho-L-lactate/phosphoenolpyruvate guanylyltransferase
VHVALIVPVKSFAIAKGRLANALSEQERAELAKDCASRVLAAASSWPTFVVCNDDEVAQWATQNGAHVVRCVEPGIDAAVRSGCDRARVDGAQHVVIAHSDLPLATRFDHLVIPDAITFVPDRHRDGTNVIAMPINSPFVTAYGPGSYLRHVELARALGLAHHTLDDTDLALDLDTADDLAELEMRRMGQPQRKDSQS